MLEGRHQRAPSHLQRDVALECARAQPRQRERERERAGTLLRSRMLICSCSEDHHARPGALPIRRAVERRGADEQRVRSRAIPAPSPIVSNADCSRSTRKSFRLFVSYNTRYDVFDPGSCHSTVRSSPRRSSFRDVPRWCQVVVEEEVKEEVTQDIFEAKYRRRRKRGEGILLIIRPATRTSCNTTMWRLPHRSAHHRSVLLASPSLLSSLARGKSAEVIRGP
jgi:hypothetical protein